MASSFISYHDDNIGFWIKDGLMEITCSYIAQVIDQEENIPDWLNEMKILIKENSEGCYPSYMHLDLVDYLNDETKRNKFLGILNAVERMLIKKGDFIGTDELNSFVVNDELQSRWAAPLETSIIIKAITFLKYLISGKLTIRVSDPVIYWE